MTIVTQLFFETLVCLKTQAVLLPLRKANTLFGNPPDKTVIFAGDGQCSSSASKRMRMLVIYWKYNCFSINKEGNARRPLPHDDSCRLAECS